MIAIRLIDPARVAGSILALWGRSMGPGFPLDERLFRQQTGLEKSPTLLLGAFPGSDPENLVGMILAKRSGRPGPAGGIPASGNISFVAVDPDFRRQGIGSSLLERAEHWLAGSGATSLRFGADTWHFFPGIPEDSCSGPDDFAPARAFARARGFGPGGLEHDVAADLAGLDPFGPGTGAAKLSGYRATFFDAGLRPVVDAFFARNFPGRWRHDVSDMIDAGMRGEDLLLLEEESPEEESPGEETRGRVVGFALLFSAESAIYGPGLYWRSLMGEAPGGLGPIGVDESVRGKGLGLYLLAEGLAQLKSRGCRFTVIDWTDLVGFYAKFGFHTWKSYRMYSKQLTPRLIAGGF